VGRLSRSGRNVQQAGSWVHLLAGVGAAEFIRQMRSGIFQALGQSWEHFLRSPQFMEGMKQWMDNAMAFRKMSSDFFTKVRHETQTTSREDIDR
jgi:hypothetical protein